MNKFTDFLPQCLFEYDDKFDIAQIKKGLSNINYHPAYPGYKAVINPMTLLDKSFQIYTLKLITSLHFSQESSDHNQKWSARDQAMKEAAIWLAETYEPFRNLDKKETKALMKILPEAMRCQFSLELQPGDIDYYPKDGTRKTKEMDLLMDTLQKIGLNMKIKAISILDGDTKYEGHQLPYNHGSLEDMFNIINARKEDVQYR